MDIATFRQSLMNYKMYMGDAEWRKLRTVPALKRSERMSRQLERQNNFPAVRWLTWYIVTAGILRISRTKHAAQPAGGDSADKNMWSARGAVLQPGTHAGRKCGASEGQPQAAALPGRILTHRRRCHWRCLTNPWTGKRARVCLIVMHGHWEDAKASSYFFAFCGQNGGVVVS